MSGKDYSGDDVIVTYDLPVKPYTDIYGFATGETTPKFIKSSTNLHFWQDTIDETWRDFSSEEYFDTDAGYVYPINSTTYEISWQMPQGVDLRPCTHVDIDGVFYELNWQSDTDAQIINFPGGAMFRWEFDNGMELTVPELISYIDFGYLEEFQDVAEYERISGAIWPLGLTNSKENVIDVSDIRSGYDFTIKFNVQTYLNIDGNITTPSSTYVAYWLDENYELMRSSSFAVDYADMELVDDTSFNFSITFTVPEGAEYFYVRFNTGYFYVNECYEVMWSIRGLNMSATLSAIEDSSRTMTQVTTKLNQISNKLDANQQEEEKQTGLLQNIVSDIKELPSNIANEIKEATKELFIPDAQDIADQKDQWDELLADRFGAVYEAGSIASDIAEAFVPGETQEIITFPATSFDLAGAEFVFGGWEIDVVPDGFEFAIDTLKMIINIACTLLFVNALKNRFENTLDGDD